MIPIIIGVICSIILLIFYKFERNIKFCMKIFKGGNVIVFGKKGKGKDLFFQKVINKKKERYYSNIPYGKQYEHIELEDISVSPNTYENFINGDIHLIERDPLKEGKDIFISDGGVYLPSQYNHILNKKYASMPIYYALSRHLYSQNIHVNTQALNRVWDKLREQADGYFKVLGSTFIFGMVFTTVRYYEEYETAKLNVLPLKRKLFNKEQNALAEQHTALHGEIKDMMICQFTRSLHYDTRYFATLLFGEDWQLIDTSEKG